MCLSRANIVGSVISLMALCASAFGSTATIALTGNNAAGIAGAKFATLQAGPVNDSGKIIFKAQLQNGVGGIAAGDDDGIWQFDGATTLVAREGIASVPGAAGTTFQSFHSLAVDDAGNIAFRAALTEGVGGVTGSNKEGLWRINGGVGSLVLRTGSLGVPGVTGGSFGLVPTSIHLGGDGQLAFDAKMSITGGVNTTNDGGLWRYDSGGGALVGRESLGEAPGVGASSFQAFLPPRVNNNHQFAFLASLGLFGDITANNDFGVWRYSNTGGELIARKGISPVPGVPSATFYHFSDPDINASGQIAFAAPLNTGGPVDADKNDGVWLYNGPSGALIARSGAGGVPAIPGANFTEFDPPLLNDAGAVLVKAHLATGAAGVTAANELGLWKFQGADQRLVARTGSGKVPGISGASFSTFDTISFDALGLTAVQATLAQGGSVNAANDTGLWLMGHSGGGRLIAREGAQLAGRTIASLSFLGNSGGNDGQPSGLNALGQIAFQASFTNGDSGLFLYTWRGGDLDDDGDVDGVDLDAWESAAGNSIAGDCDLDGDSDGQDFLAWQRQHSPVALTSTLAAVPEPSSVTLTIAAMILATRRKRILVRLLKASRQILPVASVVK